MHTPTPWSQDVMYVVGLVPNARPGGEVIVKCWPTVDQLRDVVPNTRNASRIVACVNAFHGTNIPTNEIDTGMLLRLAEMLDQCQAAVWDSHYGNGITADYARKATDGVLDMVRKLRP